MNTCKTCKHWGNNFPPIQGQNNECGRVNSCIKSDEKNKTTFELEVSAADDQGLEGRLMTGENFGCIHYEPNANAILKEPYLLEANIQVDRKYNPKFGDDRICECGHSYYRHFDSYEKMEACGCKYCQCYDFKEKSK